MTMKLFSKHPRFWFLARLGRHEVGLIVAVFMAAAFILGFGFLAEEVLEGDTSGFDQAVVMAFRSGGNPADPIGPA